MLSLRTLTNSLDPSSLVRPRSAQIRYRDGAFVSSLVPHAHPTHIHQRTHSFTDPPTHSLAHQPTNPRVPSSSANVWINQIMEGGEPKMAGVLEECLVDDANSDCQEFDAALKKFGILMGLSWPTIG
mmetsp:Transcript_55264/g.152155  ORF Transcript_55264/g.152155 Transcript_55264/m.152155 type:complete len:127 (+) Transcript_55264:442-822(+)